MFEGAINTLMSILSLSIGGVSVTSIIAAFIILSKKIKSVSLTKDYVEQAFEKAVLPANWYFAKDNTFSKTIFEWYTRTYEEISRRTKRRS